MLESVSGLRDLGVNVDSHLNFVSPINQIAAKAHVRSSQIIRRFLSKDVATLVKAFVIYVRPILDYCTTVWSPCAKTHIDKIAGLILRTILDCTGTDKTRRRRTFFCPPTLPYVTFSALSEEEMGPIPPFQQARTANLPARFPFLQARTCLPAR